MRYLYHYFLIFLFLCSLFQCATWDNVRVISKGQRLAVYSIDADTYPPPQMRDTLSEPEPFPKLSEKQVRALLSQLWYYHDNIDLQYTIFFEKDVNYIAPRLARSMRQLKKGERLVLVYKSRPLGNLVNTTLRHTLFLWNDSSGVNVLVGEVRKVLI